MEGLKRSLLGILSPSNWQLGSARRKQRSLSKALGHNSPDILLITPGEGKQVLGFLPKGDPKPGGTQIKDCETLGIGSNSRQDRVRFKHQGKSGFDDFIDRSQILD